MNDAVKMAIERIKARFHPHYGIDGASDSKQLASDCQTLIAAIEQAGEPVADFYYPIEMPLNADGHGPATVGEDAASMAFEVWDQFCDSHGRFDRLSDAIRRARQLNALPTLQRLGQEDAPDYAELKRLYNFSDDDSAQFTRWNMLTAIRHGKRLGQEFDAGEALAALLTKAIGDITVALTWAGKSGKIEEWTAPYVAAVNQFDSHPAQSRGQAFDGEGEAIKGKIGDGEFFVDGNKFDLIFRPGGGCYGGGDKIVARMACGETAYWLPSLVARLLNAALSSAKRGEEG